MPQTVVIHIRRVFATEPHWGFCRASYAVLESTSILNEPMARATALLDARVVPMHQYDNGDMGVFLLHDGGKLPRTMTVELVIPIGHHDDKRYGNLYMCQVLEEYGRVG